MASPNLHSISRPRARQRQQLPGRRLVAGTYLFMALSALTYWVTWFTKRDFLASAKTPEYYAFENAFPAADGWMAASSALAGIGLLRRKRWGIYWAIAAASSGIFLGSLDVLFNLENRIYRQRENRGGVLVEMLVNLLTLGLSTTGLVWAWHAFKHAKKD
jgi:hypothetical protein